MEQEKINANVNSLSQKLLEGCKLLSESCPETNVPLVSTTDGRMYSVGNGCYYVRDGGDLVKLAPDTPAAAAAPPATPGSPPRSGFLGFPPGAVATGSVEPPSNSAPEQSLSSRVAAKLLEGFTLLSESCPVTSVPLVQDPSGRILSVGTGCWYERTGGALHPLPPPPACCPPSSPPRASPGTRSRRTSRRAGASWHPGAARFEASPLVCSPRARGACSRALDAPAGELVETAPAPVAAVLPQQSAAPRAAHKIANGAGTPMVPSPPSAAPVMFAAPQVPTYTPVPQPATPPPPLATLPTLGAVPYPPQPAAAAGAAAVANALLTAAGTPGLGVMRTAVAPSGVNGASLKAGASDAVAVLSGRLTEATVALSDTPIREAGPYIAMIKDLALAIAALKAL